MGLNENLLKKCLVLYDLKWVIPILLGLKTNKSCVFFFFLEKKETKIQEETIAPH